MNIQTKLLLVCAGIAWTLSGPGVGPNQACAVPPRQQEQTQSSRDETGELGNPALLPSILEGQEIIVVVENAVVRDEGTKRAQLPLGSITTAGPTREKWLWLPSYRGYILLSQVLPLEQGGAFLDKLVLEHPTSANFAARGFFHEHGKQFELSLRDYEEAVKLQPNYWMAFTSRGKVYEALNRIDLARQDFDKVVNESDRPAWARMERGNFLVRTRQYELAILDFEIAFKFWDKSLKSNGSQNRDYLQSRRTDSLSDLAWCHFRLNHLEIALEKIELALVASPDDWFVRGRRRAILRKLGRNDEVLTELESELTRPDVSPVILNEFSYFLATCQDATFRNGKRSVELALKCCELKKDDPSILDTLACAWAESGDFEKAVEVLTKAIALLKPDDPERPEYQARLDLFRQAKAYRD